VWRRAEMAFGLVLYRVSVGRVLGRLLWLTGKCVQLNWSSILLDGYKKRSLPRQPSYEALLVRRPKSVKTIDSTVRLHRAETPAKDISIAFYLSSFLLLFPSVLVFITNSYYVLFVSMCLTVFFFRITETTAIWFIYFNFR